ncbi:MAG: serine/threonine-protein kinase [Sedimentisphaerales bacterium]|mgnify:FL=1|nr:serine/threonine-protein kinase [Sedimentisphaerales bacterium]NLZ06011.1 serine/threonine protein kinase [Phycisphaerae bacterium]HNY76828.1 serine/threonine-protein kinase [Sedimentisphaerales bacterium]HOC62682.1 serine/threonine-protein kinase [Sedimentisphaerales bacterium]HOH62602.1 serine/threonine-protein kinase [Sedimentisphaerales bacterium]
MARDLLSVGEFTIIRRIGNGARSTIYLATDEEDGTLVALKRVIIERPEDHRVIEQTEMEYKVAREIDHPYIRKCYKLQKIRSMFKVRELIMSMEHFDGKTLEETTTLSLGDVLLVFRMVAMGLNAMHQRGFVHCDIKPNNILINKTGSIKIIDLGQSCRIGTIKSRIQGTPDYIAPEQVKRKSLTPKTDIFNLGATMYWALTGKNVPTLIPKKQKTVGLYEPQRCLAPHQIKSQLPVPLSMLVMDCVKNDPAERPSNMVDIISGLDAMIHSIFGDKIKVNRNASNNHRSAQ